MEQYHHDEAKWRDTFKSKELWEKISRKNLQLSQELIKKISVTFKTAEIDNEDAEQEAREREVEKTKEFVNTQHKSTWAKLLKFYEKHGFKNPTEEKDLRSCASGENRNFTYTQCRRLKRLYDNAKKLDWVAE
jgi:hypothetical protein